MTTWANAAALWEDSVALWGITGSSGAFLPGNFANGPISTGHTFQMLDSDENLIGFLTSVTGGSLSWDAYDSVKGTGSLEVTDVGQTIDWLNVRVKPIRKTTSEGTGLDPLSTPLGVFTCAAPVETWTGTGRSWRVELTDKLSLLDTDIPTDASGNTFVYIAPAGANVIDLVRELIEGTGETTEALEPSGQLLTSSIVFEEGATRLKIANDLLKAGAFFSLFCDGSGRYRAVPYVQPTDRDPLYDVHTPFSSGDDSLMGVEWQRDRNIYGIPNRYVVTSQGSGDAEGLRAVAVNVDPASPYSYANRGNHWYTKSELGVEAVNLSALQSYARRRLSAVTSVSSTIKVKHLFLPDLLINTVVRFVNADASLDRVCSVINLTVPFDPVGMCSSNLLDVGPYTQVET